MQVRAIAAGIGLVLLALATRYYILGPETGDIDEATFIVVAQSVLRGYLPYEAAFDNKPAGFFYLLAGVMAVFGESTATVRLFGSLLVGATAATLLVLCRRYLSLPFAGTLAALFVLANAGEIGNSTKSELIANLFVAGSMLVLLQRQDNRASFIAGLLVSCAVLCRTNLAVLAAGLAVVHMLAAFRPGTLGFGRSAIFSLALGGLLPLAALVVPYALRGELELLRLGLVDVALSHSQGRRDLLGMLVLVPHSFVRILPSLAGLLVVIGGIALWRLRRPNASALPERRRDVQIGLLYLVSIYLSILMTGTFYNHYMLQILPPLVLLTAIGLGDDESVAWRGWPVRLMRIGVVAGAVWYVGLGGVLLVDQLNGQVERPLRAAAEAVAADLGPQDAIWAAGSTQLILFYLNKNPVVPVAAFPPNLARPSITEPLVAAGRSPAGGADEVLAMRPRYVVNSRVGAPQQLSETARQTFSQHYQLFWSGGVIHVYQRLQTGFDSLETPPSPAFDLRP